MPSDSPGPADTPSLTNLSDECLPVLGAPGAQVMTDEQLEILRRQISVYATICQQLVEMHKASMAQQGAISGSRFGQSSSCDSGLYSLGQKFSSRQRWTPSQTQLKILERLFQQGNGTPSKQNIKEISTDLSQYGQISETNVYNWFQNRRARTKRKQQAGALNNRDSEFDLELDSLEANRFRGRNNATIKCPNHLMNSEKGKHMEHQHLNAAQNELRLSQKKQEVNENFATSLGEAEGLPRGAAADMLDFKPDPVRAVAILEGEDMEMINGDIVVMRM